MATIGNPIRSDPLTNLTPRHAVARGLALVSLFAASRRTGASSFADARVNDTIG
jgi:hypothetical protein